MSTASRRVYLIALVVLAVAGLFVAARAHVGPARTSPSTTAAVHGAPDHTVEAELRSSSSGVPELWIVGADQRAVKVSRLNPGEGVRDSFMWSPHRALLAFESYDLNGHSPLTTSHVWVVRQDGSGLAQVSLPSPNQRFSTHLEKWFDDNALMIRATLLSSEDIFYKYGYDKHEVRPISDTKTP